MTEFLVWLVGALISISGLVYFYYKLVGSNTFLTKKFLLLFFFCVISLTFIYYYDISYLSTISYFLISPLLYYFVNHRSIRKLIFFTFIIWIYGIILDIIAMAFASIALHFFKFNNFWYIFECFMTILLTLLLVLFARNKKIIEFSNILFDKLINIKFMDLSLILFSLFIFSIGIPIFLNLHNLNISFLLIIIIFLIIIVFGVLIKFRVNTVENTIFLKTLKENNEFYIKMVDENRIFRHNLNAKLLGIKSVSNAKAQSLIAELLKENNHNVKLSGSIKLIPYGFNGIIYEKIYPYIKDINVKIYNNIDYDIFMMLKPRRYNVLVEKLVLTLDNAIEACQKSKRKILIINLNSVDNEIIIEIKNTFLDIIDVEALGNIGYSTKGRKRGLGLFSSLRDKEVSVSIKIINSFFATKIIARKNLSN